MRVFIPVWFHSPVGGLHEHVRGQVYALRSDGREVVVCCPSGPFADGLSHQGLQVVPLVRERPEEAVAAATELGPFDIVHAHPFVSRSVGREVALASACPMVVTFHGTYPAGLPDWQDEAAVFVAVSDAIREFLVGEMGIGPERVVVIPNGVQTDVFTPLGAAELSPDELALGVRPGTSTVLVVSRFGQDKRLVTDSVVEAWREAANPDAPRVTWLVAGDAGVSGELLDAARELDLAAGTRRVFLLGWQKPENLARLMRFSDIVVTAGRGALEALATGSTTIALGSRGYVGLIDGIDAALRGARENFGGAGDRSVGYPPGLLWADIERALRELGELGRVARLGRSLVEWRFAQERLDRELLALHDFVAASGAPP